MGTIEINKFEKVWENFLNSFRGSLITQSRKQSLSYPLVKLLFQEASLTWTSGYGINCTWLDQLMNEYPEKGMIVKEILTKDMGIVELPVASYDNNNTIKLMASVGTGAIGYVISSFMGLGMVGVAASTILPAAIAIPIAQSQLSNAKSRNVNKTIDLYINQLEKYKNSIESVLLAD